MGKIRAKKAVCLLFILGLSVVAVYLMGLFPDARIQWNGADPDLFFIEKEMSTATLSTVTEMWYWPFVTSIERGYYRPLIKTFWYLEWQAFGNKLYGWLWVSFLLHLLVITSVFIFASFLFHSKRVGYISAFCFAVPLSSCQTSTFKKILLWPPAQTELFCTIFYLLALTSFVVYLRYGSRRYFGAALALSFLACATKEMAFSLPLTATLVLLFSGHYKLREVLKKASPFWLLILFFLGIRFLGFSNFLAFAPGSWHAINYWNKLPQLAVYLFPLFPFPVHVLYDLFKLISGGLLACLALAVALEVNVVKQYAVYAWFGYFAVTAALSYFCSGSWASLILRNVYSEVGGVTVYLLGVFVLWTQCRKEALLAFGLNLSFYLPLFAVGLSSYYYYFPRIGWAIIDGLLISSVVSALAKKVGIKTMILSLFIATIPITALKVHSATVYPLTPVYLSWFEHHAWMAATVLLSATIRISKKKPR